MTEPAAWREVDTGWGRRAVEFATLLEPAACREYVALHQHLGVGDGDRVLDLACGSGLALELAAARGATCAGIDASERLVAVAADRNPGADVRVGDMAALPWADGSFDVVTSFRGIWGTTPAAVAEARRVLAPGGRLGLTVWGHIKASPGAWALAPFRLASQPKVENQAAMVALGRPGVGEAVLAEAGFVDVERVTVPFVWEFADPEAYARALAATGPAYEAVESVGDEAFRRHAVELATERVRAGLPLRAEIDVVGYLARTPAPRRAARPATATAVSASPAAGFLAEPEPTAEAQRLYDDDVEELGYVMNASRVWAQLPAAQEGLFDLIGATARAAGLSYRERGVLVAAAAAGRNDAYCALAWGNRLAERAGAEVAAAVLRGDDSGLAPREQALAGWARRVVADPNGVAAEDVAELREVGYDDAQVFAVTAFVAFRLAFSTVNDALGARPDHQMAATVAPPVQAAVTFGRPMAEPGVEPGIPAPGAAPTYRPENPCEG